MAIRPSARSRWDTHGMGEGKRTGRPICSKETPTNKCYISAAPKGVCTRLRGYVRLTCLLSRAVESGRTQRVPDPAGATQGLVA